MPRKIGELELDFENPTWKSNWDFEQFTVEVTISFTVGFTIIYNNIWPLGAGDRELGVYKDGPCSSC